MKNDNNTAQTEIVSGKEMINRLAGKLEREKTIFNTKFSFAIEAYSTLLSEVERCSNLKQANRLFEEITYHLVWLEEVSNQCLLHDDIQIRSKGYKQDKVYSKKVKISIERYLGLFRDLDSALQRKLSSIRNSTSNEHQCIINDTGLVMKLFDLLKKIKVIEDNTTLEDLSYAFTGQCNTNFKPKPVRICKGKKTAFREILSYVEHGMHIIDKKIEECKNPSNKIKKLVKERFLFDGKSQDLDHFKKDEYSSDKRHIESFFISFYNIKLPS